MRVILPALPLLLLLTSPHTGRAKRNIVSVHNPPVLNDDDDAAAGHCKRRSVVINFDDLGWNHILAPKQINFFYCEGECDPVNIEPELFLTSAAKVLYHLGKQNNSLIDSPCCAPSHLTPIELLVDTRPDLTYHVSDDPLANLEVITIPDLLVTSCGCV